MNEYDRSRVKVGPRKQVSVGKLFEQTVLSQAYEKDVYFGKTDNNVRAREGINPISKSGGFSYNDHCNYNYHENSGLEKRNMKWDWWWQPRRKNVFFEFFKQSSMHGLKYIAQPRRHLSERVFWATAFLMASATAAYLISSVWERYASTPVIVTLAPTEVHTNSIPFPTVTICNMNKISTNLISRLTKRARNLTDESSALEGRKGLHFIRSICDETKSFAKRFHYAKQRGVMDDSDDLVLKNKTVRNQVNDGSGILPFFLEKGTSCEKMILKCKWADEIADCKELFKPIYTSLGKCCAFNKLPMPLLMTNDASLSGKVSDDPNRPRLPARWTQKEIDDWKKWDYAQGFTTDMEKSEDIPYPFYQKRAGSPFGLSVLLDANLDNYFCPSSDSEGFRIGLTTPVETSNVDTLGFGIGLEQEMSVDVQPHLTLVDPDIKRYDPKSRQCVFDHEVHLDFFQPYSTSSCLQECVSKIVEQNCSCVPFSFPRIFTTKICSTKRTNNTERECVTKTRKKINSNLRQHCNKCTSLCSELTFRYKVSEAKLQENMKLWFDRADDATGHPEWAGHKMSVVHIYYGRQSIVPLLRRDLFSDTDLIANTGNVLCLCLGFSVMSAVEILFFFAVRPCWGYFRKRRQNAFIRAGLHAGTVKNEKGTDSHSQHPRKNPTLINPAQNNVIQVKSRNKTNPHPLQATQSSNPNKRLAYISDDKKYY